MLANKCAWYSEIMPTRCVQSRGMCLSCQYLCSSMNCLTFMLLGGVLNPNSFGGFLTIFSLFVNNCKRNFEQTMFDRSFI